MTQPIAPPPSVINQLSDLISLIKNVDQVGKLVDDLKAATEEHNTTLKAIADANSDAFKQLNELGQAKLDHDAREAKIQEVEEQQKSKVQFLAESEANLQAAYVNHQSRVDEFNALVEDKRREHEVKDAELVQGNTQVEQTKIYLANLQEELESKKAAFKALVGE